MNKKTEEVIEAFKQEIDTLNRIVDLYEEITKKFLKYLI